MLILHCSLLDNQFLLWGEVAAEQKARSATRKKTQPQNSPYDAGIVALRTMLQESGRESFSANAIKALAWLPSTGGWPVASSPLIAEAATNAPTAIFPWRVTACALEPNAVCTLLAACLDNELLAPGVLCGSSLHYWAQALRMASALVTRQMFLPGVVERNGVFAACWQPVLSNADATRQATLAAAMPGACRALTSEKISTAPVASSLTVLQNALELFTDHIVRTQCAAPTFRKTAWGSLHDQWLHALQTPDGALQGEARELRQLAEQIAEWRRPLAATENTPFRLCFRLEEPAEMEKTLSRSKKTLTSWTVRYLLQSADDPSLLIPAEAGWSGKGRAATALKRDGFHAREYLLRALGAASTLDSHIEASLKSATPAGYELDARGAHEFLIEKAWLLESAGYGVLLPSWWTRRGVKAQPSVRAKVKTPKMQGGSGLTLESLVKFEWEIAIGDEKLTRKELEALARLKEPLVRVRGQWVQLDAEAIQATIAFWKTKGNAISARELMRLDLDIESTPHGLPLADISASGWAGDLLARLRNHGTLEELSAPQGLHGTLRPYQARGFAWLNFLKQWGLGACLADDMGLGKTLQTLALLLHERESTLAKEQRPTLLICPTSVTGNWQREAARFTPELPVLVHHGVERKKGAAFLKAAKKQAIVISSYALLHRDLEYLQQVPWSGIILDEAQNIKNPETKTTRAARSLNADYRIALTGTPVENHIGDLWSVMEFLNPGLLGKQAEFRRDFFVPIQLNGDEEASEKLQQRTGPFILRRLKTDKNVIADLPDKLEMKVFCTLTKEQASLYAAVTADAARALDNAEDGIARKGLVLATLMKLKQVCNHPAHFLGDGSTLPQRSGKLERLTEMLEEALAAGDRALVFSQFSEMGELMRRHLQDRFGEEVLFLHGATAKQRRDAMVERFQNETKGPRIFILSLKAGGTGLNLTAANHVFHFDRWWNPAVENQATDRAFRIGQTKNVQVHKFLCAGTLEEKIDEMIESKQRVAARVVGSGEGWLTKLSNEELKDIFALRE